ncbi:CidA/LrgA family protein [Halalkalibacter sp. APA_J-10(15)]|uniref:CidA/LrgA family protein n=1 Tax=unclassified Halalkalibacter TaxID=2893063 RepID=UPI001FF0E7F4|nr:CidA/LrgA family protein [Halalkalibacter sp. APA_J-10(15)]MCK0471268.1 CidA/LrgA family protein [Halalkalibacter sp. APA_J-10(15)]
MKYLQTTLQLSIFIVIYYLGVWIQQLFSLFIPGSIIGMTLLFLALSIGLIPPKWVEQGASLMLKHLPLLFIPVTVGALPYLPLFKGRAALLLLIALISTAIVMTISGFISQRMVRKKGDELA